jgi:hypothetical protein
MYPLDRPLANPARVPNALFGAGISVNQSSGDVLIALAVLGIGAALIRTLRRRGSMDEADRLVIAGVAVILVGLVAFVKHHFVVLGTGDRAYTVSAVGVALVWVGIGCKVWGQRKVWAHGKKMAAAVTVACAMLVVPANLQRQRSYHEAGADALALVRYVRYCYGDFPPPLVIGPTRHSHDGVAPVVGDFARHLLIWGLHNPDVLAHATNSPKMFFSYPPSQRIYWRDVVDSRSNEIPHCPPLLPAD